MAAKDRGARAERERARLYQARQDYQDGRVRRRVRDNLVAGIAGGVLILAVVGGQIAYFTMGPGVPEPTPTGTSTSVPTPSPTPTGDPTPAPDATEPAPTPTP
ncbi:dioxygenase [Microbacterium sp. RU33B]|uniref:dioxygenase n=1 Tax=Microbacterium sp. RU33B TaxID=1907390 RepID=UPI000959894E|nr:dioxygenase [Microbacterium sp. RU33B]SIT75046.1 hypothetical protein SAMN05880545_1420 [Microbacterium sp. RU33B]